MEITQAVQAALDTLNKTRAAVDMDPLSFGSDLVERAYEYTADHNGGDVYAYRTDEDTVLYYLHEQKWMTEAWGNPNDF